MAVVIFFTVRSPKSGGTEIELARSRISRRISRATDRRGLTDLTRNGKSHITVAIIPSNGQAAAGTSVSQLRRFQTRFLAHNSFPFLMPTVSWSDL